MSARLGWTASLFAAVALQSGSVTAGEPAAAIRFEYVRGAGAEACPGREAVRTRLSARLRRDPFDERGTGRLRCELAGSADGLRARVETWNAEGRSTGTRTLSSPPGDCSDLASALLLVLSLASGPPGLASAPPEAARSEAPAAAEGAGTPSAPAPAAPAPAATTPARASTPARAGVARAPVAPPLSPPASDPPPSRAAEVVPAAAPPPASAAPSDTPVLSVVRSEAVARTPASFLAGAGVIGTAGALPRPSWGVVLTAGVRWGVPSLSLEGRYDAPASVGVDDGGRIRVWTASLAAVPCLHLGPFAGCAMAGAGIIRGAGVAVPAARTDLGPWALLGLRAAAHVQLSRTLLLKAHADLLAAPVETRMSLGDSAVWTTPLVSGAAGLTLLALY